MSEPASSAPSPEPVPSSPVWTALSVSVRGFNHERTGQVNQDAMAYQLSRKAGDPIFLALADGHGSSRSFRSATGSALAVQAAVSELQKLIANQDPALSFREKRAQARELWPKALLKAWQEGLRADLAERPFTFFDFAPFPEPAPVVDVSKPELPSAVTLCYGATILAVAVTEHYILYAQLGDGDILTVLPDGRVRRPFPAEHTRLATSTPSLCSQYAEFGVQVAVRPIHEKSPVLILLSTDGYANSFLDEAAFRQVGTDILQYLRTEGFDWVQANLEGWLRAASMNGNGDDTTLGLIVRRDILPNPPAVPPEPQVETSQPAKEEPALRETQPQPMEMVPAPSPAQAE